MTSRALASDFPIVGVMKGSSFGAPGKKTIRIFAYSRTFSSLFLLEEKAISFAKEKGQAIAFIRNIQAWSMG